MEKSFKCLWHGEKKHCVLWYCCMSCTIHIYIKVKLHNPTLQQNSSYANWTGCNTFYIPFSDNNYGIDKVFLWVLLFSLTHVGEVLSWNLLNIGGTPDQIQSELWIDFQSFSGFGKGIQIWYLRKSTDCNLCYITWGRPWGKSWYNTSNKRIIHSTL